MPTLVRGPTREMVSPVLDSRRWAGFEPRDNDIVIATFAKCGTTWMQRIVDLLVHQSPDIRPVSEISPWLDATIFNPVEADLALLTAQTHRRYIKSHAPFDALPVWDNVKYIHVGRDGRDPGCRGKITWPGSGRSSRKGSSPTRSSWRRRPAGRRLHRRRRGRTRASSWCSGWRRWKRRRRTGRAADPHYFDFEATYWQERARENLLFVHYDDMIEDLPREMRRISDFLEIDTPESLMPALVDAARFATMKAQGDELGPMLKLAFDRGADRFINQGRSGRWREVLGPDDVTRYEAIAAR